MNQVWSKIVGSLGTLIGAIYTVDFDKFPLLGNVFLLAVAAFVTALMAIDAFRAFTNRTKTFDRSSDSGKDKIAKYLVGQLGSSGSVVVFSKDLTWVKSGGEAEELLIKKAKDGELTLFVENEMPITTLLKSHGAGVRAYGGQKKKGFSPKSRFTVLDYRAGRTQVMVGISSNGKHLIKHYGEDDCEVVDLARDFISLLECTAKVVK